MALNMACHIWYCFDIVSLTFETVTKIERNFYWWIFDKYKKIVVKRIISIFQVIYKNSRWDPTAHECINDLIYDFAI